MAVTKQWPAVPYTALFHWSTSLPCDSSHLSFYSVRWMNMLLVSFRWDVGWDSDAWPQACSTFSDTLGRSAWTSAVAVKLVSLYAQSPMEQQLETGQNSQGLITLEIFLVIKNPVSSWWTLRNWSNQAAIWNITFCHPNFIPTVLFAYNTSCSLLPVLSYCAVVLNISVQLLNFKMHLSVLMFTDRYIVLLNVLGSKVYPTIFSMFKIPQQSVRVI